MKCVLLYFLVLVWACSPLRAQDAGPVYQQDFERSPVGTALPGGVRDNTYAGGPTPMRIVKCSDARLGNALEIEPHGFTQIVLGEMALKKDALYRVSLDIASRGPQQVTLMLRLIPWPYTGFIASTERTNETVQRVSFLGRAPADASAVGLFLNMNGFTTLTIDNIRVEEVTGPLPPGEPPAPGNLLPNAGFEIGGDGWFTRGPVEFIPSPDAAEGRRVAVMHGVRGQDILSSTFFPLSFQSDYIVQARIRAVSASASVKVWLAGKEAGLTVTKSEGWRTLSLRVRPQPPSGKIVPLLNDAVGLECQGEGGTALVDAVSVQAVSDGQPDPPFAPKAPLELSVATDAPEGVLTVGESATATVLASAPISGGTLQIRDENERLIRTLPLRFQDRQAKVRLSGLPPGYWHLITTGPISPSSKPWKAIPGESFLAVIPKQPTLPASQWFYGTHIIDFPAMRRACWKLGLRWDRLHDTGLVAKWPTVQPENSDQWLWHDDEIARRRAEGQALLGNMDDMPGWAAKKPKVVDGKAAPNQDVTGAGEFTDATFPQWQEFCRRVAEHDRGRIDAFEILNEPNLRGVSPELYLRILQSASASIRAGNPRAQIVAPAVGGSIDDGWLLDVIRRGAGRYCDVITFHGYGLDTWASLGGPQALQRGVRDLRAALAAAGTPNKPIWEGECGVSGVQSRFQKFLLPGWGAGATDTAQMFAKSAACAKAGGLGRIFYYAAFQPSIASETDPNVFGFGDVNGVLKMPFQSLGVAVSLLEGRQFVRQDPSDKARGVIHLIFTGRGATVHVLWKTNGSARVTLPAGTLRLVNLWGRDQKRPPAITLTPEPVYVLTK